MSKNFSAIGYRGFVNCKNVKFIIFREKRFSKFPSSGKKLILENALEMKNGKSKTVSGYGHNEYIGVEKK